MKNQVLLGVGSTRSWHLVPDIAVLSGELSQEPKVQIVGWEEGEMTVGETGEDLLLTENQEEQLEVCPSTASPPQPGRIIWSCCIIAPDLLLVFEEVWMRSGGAMKEIWRRFTLQKTRLKESKG